ncbi:MAG: hypothetical protein AB7N80_03160 [Bdellovibrionales bacterium]
MLLKLFILLAPVPAVAVTLAEVQQNPALLLKATSADMQSLDSQLKASSLGANAKANASAKLKNLVHIKQKLDECLGKLEDARGLRASILGGALADDCLSQAFGYNRPLSVAFDLSAVASAATYADVKKMVEERSLSNAARTIFDYRTQFEGAKPLPKAGDEKALKILANEICHGCSEKQRKYFADAFDKHLKETRKPSSKLSINEVLHQQNQTLAGLNARLEKMEEAKNKKDEKAFGELYDRYLEDYQRYVSTPAGALFMTGAVRDVVGKVITPEDVGKKYWLVGDKTLPRHKPLGKRPYCGRSGACQPEDELKLRQGLREIESKVADFTQKKVRAKSFTDLMKVDPALAGQMLVINPGLMYEACTSIQEITKADLRDKELLSGVDTFVNVLDGASMALMVTGVGGVVAKGISSVAAAGARAATRALASNLTSPSGRSAIMSGMGSATIGRGSLRTTAGQIMGRTAIVGAVSEAGHAISDGGKMIEFSGRADILVASRMARATSDMDVQRLTEIESQWDESLGRLLRGSATNALPLANGLMRIRSSKYLSGLFKNKKDLASELEADAKLLQSIEILGPEGIKKMTDVAGQLGLNQDGLAGALAAAAQLPGGTEKILKALKGSAPGKWLKELSEVGSAGLACAI